jgi:hypothetical protein
MIVVELAKKILRLSCKQKFIAVWTTARYSILSGVASIYPASFISEISPYKIPPIYAKVIQVTSSPSPRKILHATLTVHACPFYSL